MTEIFAVEFDLPFVIHLEEKPIAVNLSGDSIQVVLTTRDQPHQDPRLGFTLGNSDLDKDRHGWVRYSHAKVTYPRELAFEDDEVAVLKALDALNVVISHYRDATDLVWIRPLVLEDLASATIVWPSTDGDPRVTVNQARLGDWQPKIVGLRDDLEKRIRQRALEGAPVLTHREMLSDAKDALLQGNTRIAVIMGTSAVENALDAALVVEFRRRRMRLTDVKGIVSGPNKSKWLSPEDAVRWAATRSKLTSIRSKMGLPSLDDDPTLSHELDVGTWLRNSSVHSALRPSRYDAEDSVAAFAKIIADYLEPLLSPELHGLDPVDESVRAVEDIAGAVDSRLVLLIERLIPRLRMRLVFHHRNFHPRQHERFFDISAQAIGRELHVWLDPTSMADELATEIAGVLLAYELKSEQYPRARPGPGFPVELFSRQAWEVVAKHLEMSILHLAETARLATAGFDTKSRARKSYEALEESIRSADYSPIDPNDLTAKTLPLQLMSRVLMLDEADRRALLELAASKDALLAAETRKLISAVERFGYDTQPQAVQSMAACHDLLWMLDTCIVIDDKARKVYGSQVRDMTIGARNARLK